MWCGRVWRRLEHSWSVVTGEENDQSCADSTDNVDLEENERDEDDNSSDQSADDTSTTLISQPSMIHNEDSSTESQKQPEDGNIYFDAEVENIQLIDSPRTQPQQRSWATQLWSYVKNVFARPRETGMKNENTIASSLQLYIFT